MYLVFGQPMPRVRFAMEPRLPVALNLVVHVPLMSPGVEMSGVDTYRVVAGMEHERLVGGQFASGVDKRPDMSTTRATGMREASVRQSSDPIQDRTGPRPTRLRPAAAVTE